MKITFLIQDLFQQGAQYVTALMIRGFIAKGYDVDLIVSKVHVDLNKRDDIKPFAVPSKTKLIILPERNARNNIMSIRRYLVNHQPDAIVAMSSNYTLALALASLSLPPNIRHKCVLSYVEHSSIAGFDITTMKPTCPRRFSIGWMHSLLLKKCYDVIMGVSKGTSRAIEHYMRCKPGTVIPIYNPVIDELYWKKKAALPSHPWIKNKNIPTVVAAGAHSKFKNHICLFEAIKLANKVLPVRLVLFGKGVLTENYKEWISENQMSDRIDLAGHTSNLPAEIHRSDAFIISSNQESFSVVLVEALAAGVPVISTNCPYGPPELLHQGEFGVLVPVNDAQALANAIINQIKSPRKPAPRESWEPFTVENVVTAYEKALGLTKNN